MDKLQFFAKVLDRFAAGRAGRLARWSGLLALNYHRIGDARRSEFDHGLYSATQEEFDEQVAFLSREFDVIGPGDLAGLSAAPPGRNVLITFDDGYRDNYELAFPVLKAHKAPATFFVATGFVGSEALSWWDEIAWMVRHAQVGALGPSEWLSEPVSLASSNPEPAIRTLLRRYKGLDGSGNRPFLDWLGGATRSGRCLPGSSSATWMTWDMVREMRASGMSIGGHTVNHPVLSRLDLDAQRAEIRGAGDRIRAEIGEPMRWFAYPVGGRDAFDSNTRRALSEVGVELSFSYYGGFNGAGEAWDRYDIRRVAIETLHDGPRFRATASFPILYGDREQSIPRRLRATAANFNSRSID